MAYQIGDYVPEEGYQIMAHADCDHGTVRVYSNNSSHFLVGYMADEAMVDGEPGAFRLEGSFPYNDDDVWQTAYRDALQHMMNFALRRV